MSVWGELYLFVGVEAACNSVLCRLEAAPELFGRSATELRASEVPVLFGGAHLLLGLRQAPPGLRSGPQGVAPHGVHDRGAILGLRGTIRGLSSGFVVSVQFPPPHPYVGDNGDHNDRRYEDVSAALPLLFFLLSFFPRLFLLFLALAVAGS